MIDREDASWHSYDSSIAEGTEESVSCDYVIIIDKLIIEVTSPLSLSVIMKAGT